MIQNLPENCLQKAPLYEQVADLLESQILTQRQDGFRLPSEQQLAEQYQVSRTIIREALKLLKERALINSKIGSGAYVTKPEAQNIADVVYRIVQMDHISYASVFDVRTILETEAASQAAHFVSEKELSEMVSCLERLKNPALTPKERAEYDYLFHYMIAEASRNPLLALITTAISSVYREILHKAFTVQGGVDDSIIRHNKILEALQNHDEIAAREAMEDHLKKSRQNIAEYFHEHPEDNLDGSIPDSV